MSPFMPRRRAGDKERMLCPSCKQAEDNRAVYAKKSSLIHLGHDSGDSETLYHCPFCGAGQLVARSDHTTECQYCGTVFTVQVQPKQQGMPQTINGQPMDMPGMPGDPMEQPPGTVTDTPNRAEGQPPDGAGAQAGPPGTPMGPPESPAPPPGGGPPGSAAGGPPGANGGPPGQGPKAPPPQGGGPPGSGDKTPPGQKGGKGQPPQGGGPPGAEKKPPEEGKSDKPNPEKSADDESKSDDGKKKPPWLGQPKSSVVMDRDGNVGTVDNIAYFMTHRGIALPEDAYVRYMAMRFADDKDAVIDQVRTERGAA
jgi:hypothetical protein